MSVLRGCCCCLGLVLLLAVSACRPGKDADEERAPVSLRPTALGNGGPGVTLTADALAHAGLEVVSLQAVRRQSEAHGFGRVLSIQDLATARQALTSAAAAAAGARAREQAAAAELRRLQGLHDQEVNVSAKAVEAAAAASAEAAAAAASAEAALSAQRAATAQAWGAQLARSLEEGGEVAARLLSLSTVPVLVTVQGATITRPPDRAVVVVGDATCPAGLVAVVPRTDGVLQGPAWLYEAAAPAGVLAAGMNVEVRLPSGTQREGVEVQRGAEVWWQGGVWVYVEEGSGRYRRAALIAPEPTERGWFVVEGLAVGDRVVVRGGQTLLSEELKGTVNALEGE
jgi:hypothetical protein